MNNGATSWEAIERSPGRWFVVERYSHTADYVEYGPMALELVAPLTAELRAISSTDRATAMASLCELSARIESVSHYRVELFFWGLSI
jgi:hypothetical protein